MLWEHDETLSDSAANRTYSWYQPRISIRKP
jgi:hypothetical protein